MHATGRLDVPKELKLIMYNLHNKMIRDYILKS